MAYYSSVAICQAMYVEISLARSNVNVKAKPADVQWHQNESVFSLSWFLIYPIIPAFLISESLWQTQSNEVHNLHITGFEHLPTPDELRQEFALKGQAFETVREGHRAVKSVLERTDPRLLAVVGPCSIHNPDEAMQVRPLAKPLADELSDELLILMRVYFEKPERRSAGKD